MKSLICFAALVIGVGAQSTPQYMHRSSPQFAGMMTGPAINTSVNTQINVMAPPFSAKGDCVSDDHAAIIAAQSAAMAYVVAGKTTPAALFFPKPPGGCYLTSTIDWLGVPLEGPKSGIPLAYGPVVLRGEPGQDIIHVQDPSLVSTRYASYWSIENITLLLDDSIASSFPHRWPGRWFDDAGMTSGSAILTSRHAMISCGDVGQAIRVNGAGTAGANLVTTIQSVFPCWTNSGAIGRGAEWQRVTLAAAASTTVSNSHAYISVANLPVTATIGAAAIAMDDIDADMGKWPNPTTQGHGGLYNILRNLNLATTSGTLGGQNNTAGIYTQGQHALYGLRAEHVNVQRFKFGVVQGCAELNSFQASCSGDYEQWNHMNLNGITYPWIEYNGIDNHYSDIQIFASFGPQFLQSANTARDTFDNAIIENSGYEIGNMMVGGIAWRVEGGSLVMNNIALTGGVGSQTSYLDTTNALCNNCLWSSVFNLNGVNNRVIGTNADVSTSMVNDGGRGNRIVESYRASPRFSLPASQEWSPIATRGVQPAGRLNPDFLEDGNSTPYVKDDLFIWPKDVVFQGYGKPYSQYYANDVTSPTGGYLIMLNSLKAGLFSQYMHGPTAGSLRPGANVPIGSFTFYFLAKCPTPASQTMGLYGWNGTSTLTIAKATFKCTTMWTQFSVRGMMPDLGNANGAGIYFQNPSSSAEIDIAWMYVRPDKADFNGKTLPLVAALRTSATTTDSVPLPGMTASGHCSLTATNASAALNTATTYVSAKTTDRITVTHANMANMTYDVSCTSY